MLVRPGPPFFIDADGGAAHEFIEEGEAGQRRRFLLWLSNSLQASEQ